MRVFFFFQAEDGIRDIGVTGVQTCALPILLLRALVLVAPFGFLATEAGWIVTEVGRQPWVVQGLMRTSAAVTPMPGLIVPMALFTLLYLGLGAIVVALITSLVRETSRGVT